LAKDMSESLYDALAALVAADTGAGGLANTTGSQYVRKVIQKSDPNYDGRLTVWPSLIVDVMPEAESHAFGSSYTSDRATSILRIEVVSKRDPKRAVQNAVNDRLRQILSRVALSGTDWAFSKAVRVRGHQSRDTGTEYHYVHEYAVRGRVGSTADVVGMSATVTVSGGDFTGVTFSGEVVQSALRRQYNPVQRSHDLVDRWSPEAYSGTLTVRGVLSGSASAIPPRPAGTAVTVTLAAFTGVDYVLDGVVEESQFDARAGADPQVVSWRIRVGLLGDTNTNTGSEAWTTV
jgi:hypothetical protein